MLFFVLSDIVLIYFSLHLAYALRFDFLIEPKHAANFFFIFIIVAALKIAFLTLFRVYQLTWRYFSLEDVKKIVYAHLAAVVAFFLLHALIPDLINPVPRSAILIDFFLSLALIGSLRISKRLLIENAATDATPALLIGVNAKSASLIKSANDGSIDYSPAGIIAWKEENRSTIDTYIQGVRVYGVSDIETVIEQRNIRAAIINVSLPPEQLQPMFERLNQAGITQIKMAKLLGTQHDKLEDLSIEDLLARHPKDLDTEAIASFIKGKNVLITGAGGSIGSEIARQCDHFGAANLYLLDNSEYNLYSIGENLPNAQLHMVSVLDTNRLQTLFEREAVDIVIHAAAYKHVPLCEANPEAAVRNNVLGTKNVIDMSIAHGISKVVIISTDKAVRPTNVMGATKRIGELYAQNVDAKKTEIVAVRFGNVLGSSGSVIPKFKSQIEAGGPVTVTHPEITRYFMLISEACQLVLQAASIAKGKELFILNMGEPVKIVDLAEQMIRLYGKENEISIEFCGLRPGEKLYEELLIDESERKTEYESITIASSTVYDIEKLQTEVAALSGSADVRTELKRIVPEYTPDQI